MQVAPARYRPVAPVALALGIAIAAGIYVFGRNHTPDYTTSLFGETGTGTLSLKSWIATGVLAGRPLVLPQPGRSPGDKPHSPTRVSGTEQRRRAI